jgi:hypothetical protein
MAVVQGASAGSFAPTGMYGMIINEILASNGLSKNPLVLFISCFAAILLTVVIAYLLYGRRRIGTWGSSVPGSGELLLSDGDAAWDTVSAGKVPHSSVEEIVEERREVVAQGNTIVVDSIETEAESDHSITPPVWTPFLVTALVAILALAAMIALEVIFHFGMHLGFVALILVVVVSAIFPKAVKGAVANVAWPTTLLVCGVVTYVALLQNQGVVDWLGNSVANIGAPLLAALAVFFIAAIVSALASTTGILAALVPLAIPFLMTGQLWVAGVIAGLGISASVVDCSPFSTNGALMVAYSPEAKREKTYRHFLGWGGVTVLAAPLLSWLALVVLPSVFR